MRVAVIGAGVVGALVARELCRYEVDVLVFEREPEPGFGVTKANSAIVHAGFHDEPGTLRARFGVQGNALFPEICGELSVPFRRTGALVLAFSSQEEQVLRALQAQGEANGVPGLEVLDRDEVLAREPRVNPAVRRALWAPSVGITEPWSLAQAAVENATDNGAELHFEEEVLAIAVRGGAVQTIRTNKGIYGVDAVVNAAGLYADRVAALAGVPFPVLHPRRGQYVLLDAGQGWIRCVLFPVPTPKSKGILVVPTVDGKVLFGPTAEDVDERDFPGTTADGISQALAGARRLLSGASLPPVLKAFAGVRPEPEGGDFVVGASPVRGFYHAGGMRSPGLTAAPAVARFLVHEVLAPDLGLRKKERFNPVRPPIPRVEELSEAEWAELIRRDPRWGRVVCFCHTVTEAQVVEAIRRGARTVDGVKFRTRAGFGRCQGSFCAPHLLRILARELGCSLEEVTLRGPGTELLRGVLRP